MAVSFNSLAHASNQEFTRRKPALTADLAGDPEPELEIDARDAPLGDNSQPALVAEPAMLALADPALASVVTGARLSRIGPDGQRRMETFLDGSDTMPPVDEVDDQSPTGGLEISPFGAAEITPANDDGALKAAPDAGRAMQGLRAFLSGSRVGPTAPQDAFSFGALVGAAGDAAPVELDPFVDAIDPVWMGEVMATLLDDPGFGVDLPDAPAPTVEIQLDNVDGWVV